MRQTLILTEDRNRTLANLVIQGPRTAINIQAATAKENGIGIGNGIPFPYPFSVSVSLSDAVSGSVLFFRSLFSFRCEKNFE